MTDCPVISKELVWCCLCSPQSCKGVKANSPSSCQTLQSYRDGAIMKWLEDLINIFRLNTSVPLSCEDCSTSRKHPGGRLVMARTCVESDGRRKLFRMKGEYE